MQIASFILVNDRVLQRFVEQLEYTLEQLPSPTVAFLNLVPMRLQELGVEHPISIPFNTLFPMDQVAGRQHERLLSVFEDPAQPTRLGRLAQSARAPIYYVPPGRVLEFARELERLSFTPHIRPDDVETLLGKRLASNEMPAAIQLLEAFRHDLHQVYRDAAYQRKGVVVLIVNQPEEFSSEEGFPRAA